MSGQSRAVVDSNLSKDPRVQAALLNYLERVDRNKPVDLEAFLAQHAEVSDELRSLIAISEGARRLEGAPPPKPGWPQPPAAIVPPVRSKAEISTHSVVDTAVESGVEKPQRPALAQPASQSEAADSWMTRRSVAAVPPKSPPPTKFSNDLPEFFGRYLVKQKLGEGAMGAVYLAEDSLLQRKVALKTPTFENDEDGELLRRFHREARAVSKLKHQNLCGVYDVGEIDGRYYISMEFVPGKKLQQFIKPDKPMTEKQAMAVVRKIALAMHEAHTHGVIHRDLKPDNIMVNEKGEPVVMDFGLVHKTDQQNSTRITQRGTLIGSPAYMSKEQVEGDPDKLTGATDQYSLGVILYQLLTSKLPFEGGLHAVLGAILTREPPPPSEHRPDLNPNLEAVCLRMMAKEAKDRFPSMKAAAEALADVVRGTSTLAGESVVVRGRMGSLNEASLDTTFEETPEAASHGRDDFDFDSAGELPPVRKPRRRKRPQNTRGPLVGGITAGLVLLAAIIWFQFGDARVKVEVLAEGFEVKFNEAEITVTDGLHETRVKPGRHTLHIKPIKSGADGVADEFDTEHLTLSKGGKPVLVVTRENSETVVKLDGVPVPRKSFSKSSTGDPKSDAGHEVVPNKPTFDEWDLAKPLGKSQWTPLDDGVLHGGGAGWLATKQDYSDFELSLEYQLPSGGNSGVFVRAAPTGKPDGTGFVGIQLLDDNAPANAATASVLQTGSLWNIEVRKRSLNTTPNQWHALVVRAVGPRIQVTHDGTEALDTDLNSVKIPPTIKRQPSGRIGLQSMTTAGARFRNITIRDLTKTVAKIPADAATMGTATPPSSNIPKPLVPPPKLFALSELNTSGADTAAWVSADGRRIYWQQNLVADDDSTIWQAERASAVEPFGNKKLITDGEQPTLTPDELQMVFIRRDATRNKRLYTASRKAISDKFSSETELKQFGNNLGFNSPFLSADGLSLFVNARSTARTAITDAVYNVSRRKSMADAWPPMVPFSIVWDAVAQKAPLTWIAMEPDELSFLATHELDVGQFRILRFTRSRKTEPFAKYEYLSIPGMNAACGRAARYIAATRELFLTAPADYAAASSLTGWQAGNHELWVIRDVVLSDSEKPLDPPRSPTQPTSETNKIPTDAVVFQKKRFKLFTEELTWQEAKKKCQQMGGRLAEVRSKEENEFIMKLAIERIVEGVWLGATDRVAASQSCGVMNAVDIVSSSAGLLPARGGLETDGATTWRRRPACKF